MRLVRFSERQFVLRLVLLAAGIAILSWIVIHFGLPQIIDAIRHASKLPILAGVIVYSLSILVRSYKWRILLLSLGTNVEMHNALALYVSSQALGNLTPARTGEFIMPFVIRSRTESSIGAGFSLLLADRALELAFLSIFMVLSFLYFLISSPLPPPLIALVLSALVLLLLVLFLFLFVLCSQHPPISIVAKLTTVAQHLGLGVASTLFLRANEEAGRFFQGLSKYRSDGVFPPLVALTCLAWILDMVSFFFLVNSVVRVPFALVAASQILAWGAGLASLVPNGIGVTAISFVYLIESRGYSGAGATAGVLLGTVLNFGLVLLLATFFAVFSPHLTIPKKSEL